MERNEKTTLLSTKISHGDETFQKSLLFLEKLFGSTETSSLGRYWNSSTGMSCHVMPCHEQISTPLDMIFPCRYVLWICAERTIIVLIKDLEDRLDLVVLARDIGSPPSKGSHGMSWIWKLGTKRHRISRFMNLEHHFPMKACHSNWGSRIWRQIQIHDMRPSAGFRTWEKRSHHPPYYY